MEKNKIKAYVGTVSTLKNVEMKLNGKIYLREETYPEYN